MSGEGFTVSINWRRNWHKPWAWRRLRRSQRVAQAILNESESEILAASQKHLTHLLTYGESYTHKHFTTHPNREDSSQ